MDYVFEAFSRAIIKLHLDNEYIIPRSNCRAPEKSCKKAFCACTQHIIRYQHKDQARTQPTKKSGWKGVEKNCTLYLKNKQ